MADQMLHFPARSSSALDPLLEDAALSSDAAVVPPPPTPAIPLAPARYRGLFLVKGERLEGHVSPASMHGSAISQTRIIVAQVEQEIAAIAARRQAERFGRVHPMPAADRARDSRRDTPWAVLVRLLRTMKRD